MNWDTIVGIMKVYQLAFVWDLVIEEGLINCNTNVIIMRADWSIKMTNPEDYDNTDLYIYQKFVEKLMYFSWDIRLDITFIVRQLNRHNANLRERHLQATERVLRYLKTTIEIKLIFSQELVELLSRNSSLYRLVGYVNSNFSTKDLEYRKSVMDYCFFIIAAVGF